MPIPTHQINRVLQSLKNHICEKNWDRLGRTYSGNSAKTSCVLSDELRMKTSDTIEKKLAIIINRNISKDIELRPNRKFQTESIKLKFEDGINRKIKFSFNQINTNNCKKLMKYDDMKSHRFLRFS